MTLLRVTEIGKSYGDHAVLRDVSLEAEQGTVLALIGPSGSGKSTLLKCLNGLTPIDAGRIDVAGHVVTSETSDASLVALRRDVGLIFQQFHLWPHKTALANIMEAPMGVRGFRQENAEEQAMALLRRFGLEGKADAYPSTLSGGQQQRVAVARALAMEPSVLLLDEVTSALDPELAWEMRGVIRDVAREGNRAMVLVTHDLFLARDIADEVLFLDEGRVLERGAPDVLFRNPQHERLQRFLERCEVGGGGVR